MNKQTEALNGRKNKGYHITCPNSFTKSWGIWGCYEPNIVAPLIYFKKPKRVSDELWQKIMDNIEIKLPFNLED